MDLNVPGVLSNEVNERYAQSDGYDDGKPGRRGSSVTKMTISL
jgi:hypothetical protein